MSIIGHRGLILKPQAVSGPLLIGTTMANGTGSAVTMAYPAGTVAGDLMILICHFGNTSYAASSPWTSAFITGTDQYGYNWQVYWRIASSETSIGVSTNSGYEYTLLSVRGCTSVSSVAGSWVYTTNINSGATASTNTDYAGNTVALISDRGAGGVPTLSSTGRNYVWNNTLGTYFRAQGGFFVGHASGLTISYSDVNDTYHSSGLRFRVL